MTERRKKFSASANTAIHQRSAGILLHITSLPGGFGCGDMGPQARVFADFLQRSGQRYWQLLPLNPTEQDKGYSPYSSISSIAGNTLLISPELLVEEGWLGKDDLKKLGVRSAAQADFQIAGKIKDVLFDKAFSRFKKSKRKREHEKFHIFCDREKSWLEPFALFVQLKQINAGKPWYEWPSDFKERNSATLKIFKREHEVALTKTKWLQYIFFSQWNKLKAYCNERRILLFGDLPFYVSYDSADVWSNRKIFSLDKKGDAVFVAGVPPDYFNENGQLWGMPVFRWRALRKESYSWWVTRLKKNTSLFDLLRLDHFRAFADYWAIPAKDNTAKNGSWKQGPGQHFFDVIKQKLGGLPFVAEDLGDINQSVRRLRHDNGFPGMKVLHFAFSDNMSTSEYIPHNYTENFLVYTGTHDNNTTRGWFRRDLTGIERGNLKRYFGIKNLTSLQIPTLLIRLAYGSVAKLAIIPMQDLLGLDEKARINSPATIKNNWEWRMLPGTLSQELEGWLNEQMKIFNR